LMLQTLKRRFLFQTALASFFRLGKAESLTSRSSSLSLRDSQKVLKNSSLILHFTEQWVMCWPSAAHNSFVSAVFDFV
jgi:hypothetical protein